MNISNNCVLITGGSDGIGKALAKKFLDAGNRVLITGRNISKLKSAAEEIPGLEVIQNDISKPDQRQQLCDFIKAAMPDINVLINNAGIQRRVPLADDHADWIERQAEIDTLLAGPVHLNHLLIPIMLRHKKPSLIINVTSGGAYIPQVFAPVYSACKAALHSYTVTLRHSLKNTACKVIELIPPAVQTKLAGENGGHGVPLKEFADEVFDRVIAGDEVNIGYGPTKNLAVEISGKNSDELFEVSSNRFPVNIY